MLSLGFRLFGFVGLVWLVGFVVAQYRPLFDLFFVVEMNVFFYNKKVSIFYVLCFVFCVDFCRGVLLGVMGFCFVFFVHIVFKGSGFFVLDRMDNNLVLSTRNRVPLCLELIGSVDCWPTFLEVLYTMDCLHSNEC